MITISVPKDEPITFLGVRQLCGYLGRVFATAGEGHCLQRAEIVVREGKGGKDRLTMLPAAAVAPLRRQLE